MVEAASAPAPRPISRSGVWVAAIAVIALGVYASSVALLPINNNDVWIHLVTGALVLDEGEVPTTDRYSFTAPGARYVAHEWLAGAIYAAAERVAGEPGVIAVGKLLPSLLILFLLVLLVRATRAPGELALPLALLAFSVLRRRLIARPELMAAELLLLTLWLLWRDRSLARDAGRRSRAIFALIPIQIIWANLHGSFPIGVALAAGFAAVEWLETQLAAGRRSARRGLVGGAGLAGVALLFVEPSAFGWPAGALCIAFAGLIALDEREPILLRTSPATLTVPGVGRGLAVAAAMAAACAINPLGVEIYLFPFEFTAGQNVITGFVNEWNPLLASRHLEGSLFRASYSAFIGVGLLALALALVRRRVGLLELGLFAAFVLLPLRHGRWMALSALCLVPVFASLLGSSRGAANAASPRLRALAGLLAALGAALVATSLASIWADSTLRLAMGIAVAVALVAPVLAWRGGALVAGALATAVGATLLAGLSIQAGIPDIVRGVRRPLVPSTDLPARIISREHRDAVSWLSERGAHGRLFTEYEWAGYAIHELWPEVRVFIDSRSEVYGEALLARYVEMKKSAEAAAAALDEYDADLVLIRAWPPPVPPFSPGMLEHLRRAEDWQLVYFDDASLIYARGDALPALAPGFVHFDPSRFPLPANVLTSPGVVGDLEEARRRAPRSGFVQMAYAASLDALGRPRPALELLTLAWRLNPRVAWTAQLAGEIQLREGHPDVARVWFERAARARRSWNRPRQFLVRVAEQE